MQIYDLRQNVREALLILSLGFGGGGGGAIFVLHIYFIWVEISLHVEFHPDGLPRSCRFMVGDKLGRLY